ncbi:MAG: hypothetical protein KBD78_06390 [Oligoflexales bacterium]|nr:hypothetical protein [Oligoflexales bacterium]
MTGRTLGVSMFVFLNVACSTLFTSLDFSFRKNKNILACKVYSQDVAMIDKIITSCVEMQSNTYNNIELFASKCLLDSHNRLADRCGYSQLDFICLKDSIASDGYTVAEFYYKDLNFDSSIEKGECIKSKGHVYFVHSKPAI